MVPRLNLIYDNPPSTFVFNFKLRPYVKALTSHVEGDEEDDEEEEEEDSDMESDEE